MGLHQTKYIVCNLRIVRKFCKPYNSQDSIAQNQTIGLKIEQGNWIAISFSQRGWVNSQRIHENIPSNTNFLGSANQNNSKIFTPVRMTVLKKRTVGNTVKIFQFSRSVASDSLRPHELQHPRPPCPSPIPGVHSDSPPSSQWCHPAISSSVIPFSSCPQPLPASEYFPMSQPFAWSGQSTEVSALASFLPKNTQGWSPSEWTGWISLQSKGLSRVFSNTAVQKHQFFGTQPSSQSNSHIHTWPLEKP